MGRDQVSGGVSVPCQLATPVANVLWKPFISRKKSISVKRSRIGIKSDRRRVAIVFGQATEYHLAFVREELRIVSLDPCIDHNTSSMTISSVP